MKRCILYGADIKNEVFCSWILTGAEKRWVISSGRRAYASEYMYICMHARLSNRLRIRMVLERENRKDFVKILAVSRVESSCCAKAGTLPAEFDCVCSSESGKSGRPEDFRGSRSGFSGAERPRNRREKDPERKSELFIKSIQWSWFGIGPWGDSRLMTHWKRSYCAVWIGKKGLGNVMHAGPREVSSLA